MYDVRCMMFEFKVWGLGIGKVRKVKRVRVK